MEQKEFFFMQEPERDRAQDTVREMREYVSLKIVQLVRIGSIEGRAKLDSTIAAREFFKRYWERNPGNDQERFVVANLNTKNVVLSVNDVTVGTLNASLVHPREVFKAAIIEGASSILLSHNHPSSDVNPSNQDIAVTRRLMQAGEILGIRVLDHLIHGDGTGELLSLQERGDM